MSLFISIYKLSTYRKLCKLFNRPSNCSCVCTPCRSGRSAASALWRTVRAGTVVVGGGAGGVGCSRGFEIVIAAGRVDVWSSLRSRRDSRAANSQDVDRMVVGSRLGF